MKQFSRQQWQRFRLRVTEHPDIVRSLIQQNAAVLDAPLLVPERALATWNLYYFCPDHGVRLVWDRASPKAHRCPVDNAIFRGEPYDGAWWREMNGRNARACYQLGLLWQLTQEPHYLELAETLLARYATHYPDYQEHGGIPHNGPGKMNAQTLCEANCLLDMALGYDLIADALSAAQREHICSRLLRPGAAFLMAHRTPQRHNHEVKIGAAIAVIGLILDDEALLNFAVTAPYGLRWQLENALFEEGLWFEGSIHYHYYALAGFMAFEKLARGTRWSLLDLPFYRKMLSFPLSLLMPDGTFPRLNDCIAGQEKLTHSDIYEFAYACYGDERYADALRFIYRDAARDNLDALLYGVEALEEGDAATLIPTESLHAPHCGLTIWRRAQAGRALLIKHTPYGGEHDHYDRLGLILFDQGRAVLPDLGTTGYGARMHYDYYKNSATHNTLSVDQSNQPPAHPVVHRHHRETRFSWLDCETDWAQTPPALGSHVRVEWDALAWRDIRFRRRLLWLDDAIIDVSTVHNPHARQLDWTLHLSGKALDQGGTPASFSQEGPLSIMQGATVTPLLHSQPRHFSGTRRGLAIWLAGKAMLWQGYAPDNPAVEELSYLVLRSEEREARFISVWDLNDASPMTEMKVIEEANGLRLQLFRGARHLTIDISDDVGALPLMRPT